jgi:two-component system CheB/CheR fusion protein
VVLDIGMPGMDGCEVARRLRQTPERRGTLLVALTANIHDRQRCLDAGFDFFLTKPCDPQELRRLLDARRPLIGVTVGQVNSLAPTLP